MSKLKVGDTIVEVTFAIAVFAFVAIISVSLMNSGIAKAQASLEITMARNEIDAQAEALRFVHNSFLTERNLSNSELAVNDATRQSNKWYAELWRLLTRDYDANLPLINESDPDRPTDNGLAIMPNKLAPFNIESCDMAYNGWTTSGSSPIHYDSIYDSNAFVLNTRLISPNKLITGGNQNVIYLAKNHKATFTATPLYPRIIYSTKLASSTNNSDQLVEGSVDAVTNTGDLDRLYRFISRVEGLWVISVRDATKFTNLTPGYIPTKSDLLSKTPEYYDFHIRTCWYAPGRDIPTTIATIVRLYNPEYVEASR